LRSEPDGAAWLNVRRLAIELDCRPNPKRQPVPGTTSNSSVTSVRDFPILKFTAAPELVGTRVLRFLRALRERFFIPTGKAGFVARVLQVLRGERMQHQKLLAVVMGRLGRFASAGGELEPCVRFS
jgi:hypothetical protein